MHHIFTLVEIKEFITVLCLKSKSFDEDFKHLEEFYNDSLYWDRKLLSLNHIASRVLEQLEKEGANCEQAVECLYQFQNRCDFAIQEGSVLFLESLFRNDCGSSLTLEEELIIAQNRLER